MARLITSAVLAVTMGVQDIYAQSADDPVIVAAAEAKVQPWLLAEAMLTVGESDPREYLYHSGELERPRPPAQPTGSAAAGSGSSVWDVLSRCEATGNWAAATGNGYYGGLQFDRQTWLAYGGGAFAPTANLASKAQQIAIAERLRAARGYQPWPACRRLLRLP